MEESRKIIGRLSIRQSFVFFVGCFLVLDIALCVGTSTLAVFARIQNYSRFMGVAIITYSVLCLILADILFYYVKLKKPIDLIQMSAERIASSDLDFTLQYDSMEEMEKLCSAFEYMRGNLQENNRMMWRQMEERRKVNSVFAHDMRTPLTVLKGYLEIFEVQPEELDVTEIRQNAIVMKKHIARLESYVEVLNEIQKAEDIRLCPKRTEWESLKEQVRQSADIRLVVKDDGNGFSQAALKKALIPFYSESENSTNRGLGLYISNLLCQIHNGSLSIANLEKGAIVTVELSENLQSR